jgi:hypothetical protein
MTPRPCKGDAGYADVGVGARAVGYRETAAKAANDSFSRRDLPGRERHLGVGA